MTPHDLLHSIGAFAIMHSGRRLADHLIGTRDLLEQHGFSEDVCLAGLLHSIYGTNAFGLACVEAAERLEVRRVVGERAEHLAWLFGTLDRPRTLEAALAEEPAGAVPLRASDGGVTTVDRRTFLDLCAIEAANLLEQGLLDRCGRLQTFWLSRDSASRDPT